MLKNKKLRIQKQIIFFFILKLLLKIKTILKKKILSFLLKNLKKKSNFYINLFLPIRFFFKKFFFLNNRNIVIFLIIKFLFFKKLQKRFSYLLTLKSLFKKTLFIFRLFYFKSKYFKIFFLKRFRFFFNRNLRKKRNYRLIWKKKRRFFKKFKRKLWVKFKRFFKLRQIKTFNTIVDFFTYTNFLNKFDIFFSTTNHPLFITYLLVLTKIKSSRNYRKYVKYYLWHYNFVESFFDTILLTFFIKKRKRKRRILKKIKHFIYLNLFLWDTLKLKYLVFKSIKYFNFSKNAVTSFFFFLILVVFLKFFR